MVMFSAVAGYMYLNSGQSPQPTNIVPVTSNTRRKRRWWTRPIYSEDQRRNQGQHDNLMKELILSNDTVKYWKFLRMNKVSFDILLEKIWPEIERKDTKFRKAIIPGVRLVITLRYLAEGCSQDHLSFGFRVGRSTVSGIIKNTCSALINALKNDYLPPVSEGSWKKNADDFEARWQFPHCIGAIDGKHINIECPNLSGSEFRNYKSFFSIVLLAVADASYKFVYVDIGAPGSDSDGGIFNSSSLGKSLEQNLANLPPPEPIINGGSPVPYFLLGNEAFPLKNYLIKPYTGRKLNRLP
ncbi:uncharacterized protein LOC136031705 [Artemia franciscana]|uniref:uncharacterized protein LOC136031705 n=1 Tax=Artemia franciscana TaxID=6661 RepID=UPI0032DAC68E